MELSVAQLMDLSVHQVVVPLVLQVMDLWDTLATARLEVAGEVGVPVATGALMVVPIVPPMGYLDMARLNRQMNGLPWVRTLANGERNSAREWVTGVSSLANKQTIGDRMWETDRVHGVRMWGDKRRPSAKELLQAPALVSRDKDQVHHQPRWMMLYHLPTKKVLVVNRLVFSEVTARHLMILLSTKTWRRRTSRSSTTKMMMILPSRPIQAQYADGAWDFEKRIQEINRQAEASAQKGEKTPEEITEERDHAIRMANGAKIAADRKVADQGHRRELRSMLREYQRRSRDDKRQYRQRKRELKASLRSKGKGKGKAKKSSEWKEAKREYKEKRKYWKKAKLEARQRYREGKRERSRSWNGFPNEDVKQMAWVVIENLNTR
jgi:hypothetical protein